jgi:prepilin-type N-terminal cleavage/methylation domain-containing protein
VSPIIYKAMSTLETEMGDQKGFTLIELMVVVLMIGILIAIATPVFFNAVMRSKNQTCRTNLRTVDGALQKYIATTGADPISMIYLVPDYLKLLPVCPLDDDHEYEILGGSELDPPLQSGVACGDGGGRNGVQDDNHFD